MPRRFPFLRHALLLFVVGFWPTVLQAQPDKEPPPQLLIRSARVDLPNGAIALSGINFGQTAGKITLNWLELGVASWTPTDITAYGIPTNLAPGTYILTVSRGPATTQNNTFDVTIGATGPAGSPGAKGDKGEPGVSDPVSLYPILDPRYAKLFAPNVFSAAASNVFNGVSTFLAPSTFTVTTGAPAIQATSTGLAVRAVSTGGASAVFAESTSAPAVFGRSTVGPGAGVHGENTGSGSGVFGKTSGTSVAAGVTGVSTSGSGVHGETSTGSGVFGSSQTASGVIGRSATAHGVIGNSLATSGAGVGVAGLTASPTGYGVQGFANALTGGTAILGISNATSGFTTGVQAFADKSPDGVGVGATGAQFGVFATANGTPTAGRGVTGVQGQATATSGWANGVQGTTQSQEGVGVFGSSPGSGVMGFSRALACSGIDATKVCNGVLGQADATNGLAFGVQGLAEHTKAPAGPGGQGGVGVLGRAGWVGGMFQVTSLTNSNILIGTVQDGPWPAPSTTVFRVDATGAVHANAYRDLAGNPMPSGGDITGVAAGTGLSGGGTTGDVSLALNTAFTDSRYAPVLHGHDVSQISNAARLAANTFTGTQTIDTGNLDLRAGNIMKNGVPFLHNFGTSNTFLGVAAGNMTMTGSGNTAIGSSALAFNTQGNSNTATGTNALFRNTTGGGNTASGHFSMNFNTTGDSNMASGYFSLSNNTTGGQNTATGVSALSGNTTGSGNTASGLAALQNNNGSNNVAVGVGAGRDATTGSNNIYLGANVLGVAGETNTMYLGKQGTQTKTVIAGIRGITTVNADAIAVMIDSTGQLGTVSSSRRFKEDIHDMGEASRRLLQLRPVTFRYTQAYGDGSKPVQYGLIAEEVAEVYPDLVVHASDGQVETVQYDKVNAMLLNEVQKQHRQIAAQAAQIEALRSKNDGLSEQFAALAARLRGLEDEQISARQR